MFEWIETATIDLAARQGGHVGNTAHAPGHANNSN